MMEVVRGLSIADGSVTPQNINITFDSDKKGYVILPNGIVYASIDGAIHLEYSGIAGKILIVYEKTSLIFTVSGSDFIGKIKILGNGVFYDFSSTSFIDKIVLKNAAGTVEVGNSNITNLICDKATYISADYGSLSAFSIGNFLLNAIKYNRTIAGDLSATSGTNATTTEINAYLVSQGTTLSAVLAQLATWTITLNAGESN